MCKAFGLVNGRFISAEGVLGAGYTGGARGFGPTYDSFIKERIRGNRRDCKIYRIIRPT